LTPPGALSFNIKISLTIALFTLLATADIAPASAATRARQWHGRSKNARISREFHSEAQYFKL